MSLDFKKFCRLCANERPTASINLYSDASKRHQLADKIRLCLPISIDENDSLPKEICITCLAKLDICNELYNTSFMAQNILKSKLECIMIERQFKDEEARIHSNITTSKGVIGSVSYHRPGTLAEMETAMQENFRSRVISADVEVRLTCSNFPVSNDKPKDYVFDDVPLVEQESVIPCFDIIVTDITGAPLRPLPYSDDSEPPKPHLANAVEIEADSRFSGGGSNSNSVIEPDSIRNSVIEPDSIRNSVNEANGYTQCTEINVEDSSNIIKPSLQHNSTKKNKSSNKRKHAIYGPQVKCRICCQWVVKDIIDSHLRLHLKERLYSCLDCGKDFGSAKGLASHPCEKT